MTLIDYDGVGKWSLSYNEASGKFILDRNGYAKNDETIIVLKFKANNITSNTTILVNNISVSDGETQTACSSSSIAISISDIVNKEPNQGTDVPKTPSNSNQGGTNQSNTNTNSTIIQNEETNQMEPEGTQKVEEENKTNNVIKVEDDYQEEKRDIKLTKVEENNTNSIIVCILIGVTIVFIIIIIILTRYLIVSDKNTKKLERGR